MVKEFYCSNSYRGQDVNLLHDGKRCISFNYEKIILCVMAVMPFFKVVAISSLPLSTL